MLCKSTGCPFGGLGKWANTEHLSTVVATGKLARLIAFDIVQLDNVNLNTILEVLDQMEKAPDMGL